MFFSSLFGMPTSAFFKSLISGWGWREVLLADFFIVKL
jgi:hypothetical protein